MRIKIVLEGFDGFTRIDTENVLGISAINRFRVIPSLTQLKPIEYMKTDMNVTERRFELRARNKRTYYYREI